MSDLIRVAKNRLARQGKLKLAQAIDDEIERLEAELEELKTQFDNANKLFIEDNARLRDALECYARVDWWPEQLRSHDYLRRLAEEALKGFESE